MALANHSSATSLLRGQCPGSSASAAVPAKHATDGLAAQVRLLATEVQLMAQCWAFHTRQTCNEIFGGSHQRFTNHVVSAARRANLEPAKCACAIVSTSGILHRQAWARAIDAASLIIRFGAAPVLGYQMDVGSRTSIRILTPPCPDAPAGLVHVADGEPEAVYIWFMSEEAGDCTEHVHHFHRNRSNPYLLVTASSVLRGSRRFYPRGKLPLRREVALLHRLPGRDGFSKMPSMGLMALHYLFVYGFCDQVRLYGFDSEQHTEKNVAYHYCESGGLQLQRLVPPSPVAIIANPHAFACSAPVATGERGVTTTTSIAYHYSNRGNAHLIAGLTPSAIPAAQRWPLALGETHGHNFQWEHTIFDALAGGASTNRSVELTDYLMLLVGKGVAWQRLQQSRAGEQQQRSAARKNASATPKRI
jgi:hypothetical protein